MSEAGRQDCRSGDHNGSCPVPGPACPAGECDGRGAVWVDVCTCGTGPSGYYGMHERYCGAEPCPAGCAFTHGAQP